MSAFQGRLWQCLRHSVGLYLPRSMGSGQGAGLAAAGVCTLPAWLCILWERLPCRTTPLVVQGVAQLLASPQATQVSLVPSPVYICFSVAGGAPLTLNKGAAAQISGPSCLTLAPGASSGSPGTTEREKLSHQHLPGVTLLAFEA